MIGPAIYALVDLDPDLMGLLKGRFTPGIIPQDQPVPCAYYGTDRIKLIPVRDPMGCFSGTLEIGFQVEEDSYDELEAITAAFGKRFDNYRGKVAGVSLAISTGQTTPDDFDSELRLHTRSIEYTITGQLNHHS